MRPLGSLGAGEPTAGVAPTPEVELGRSEKTSETKNMLARRREGGRRCRVELERLLPARLAGRPPCSPPQLMPREGRWLLRAADGVARWPACCLSPTSPSTFSPRFVLFLLDDHPLPSAESPSPGPSSPLPPLHAMLRSRTAQPAPPAYTAPLADLDLDEKGLRPAASPCTCASLLATLEAGMRSDSADPAVMRPFCRLGRQQAQDDPGQHPADGGLARRLLPPRLPLPGADPANADAASHYARPRGVQAARRRLRACGRLCRPSSVGPLRRGHEGRLAPQRDRLDGRRRRHRDHRRRRARPRPGHHPVRPCSLCLDRPIRALTRRGRPRSFVGTKADKELLQALGSYDEIDAQGQWVTPGIVDMHSHAVRPSHISLPLRAEADLPSSARLPKGVGSMPALDGAADGNSLASNVNPQLRSLDGFNVRRPPSPSPPRPCSPC